MHPTVRSSERRRRRMTTDADPTMLARVARAASAIAAQTGLLTALLYLGWTRTRSTASRLGLDPSLFGYSTQEYVLRSVDSMLVPVTAALAILLLQVVGIEGLGALVAHGSSLSAPLRRTFAACGAAGLLALAVGIASVFGMPIPHATVAGPARTLSGACLLGLALTAPGRVGIDSLLQPIASNQRATRALTILLTGLGVVAAFSLTAEYADVVGRTVARDFIVGFASRPEVVLVSNEPLSLTRHPGVRVDQVDDLPTSDPSAHRYCYTGLKLLAKAGGTYYLIPAQLSDDNMTIGIPVRDGMRLDFDWATNRHPVGTSP